MLIMYLLGMLFHPANVSSLIFALELKSCSALCAKVVMSYLDCPYLIQTPQFGEHQDSYESFLFSRGQSLVYYKMKLSA